MRTRKSGNFEKEFYETGTVLMKCRLSLWLRVAAKITELRMEVMRSVNYQRKEGQPIRRRIATDNLHEEIYECPSCLYRYPVFRNHARQKERSHRKWLYCPRCIDFKNFKKVEERC
jgi:hypothetical protein